MADVSINVMHNNHLQVRLWWAVVCTALVQVKFSADGNFLYTGARKDPDILCWDIRYTSDVVYRLQRDTSDTNQRVQFDIEPMGRHLATGPCVSAV